MSWMIGIMGAALDGANAAMGTWGHQEPQVNSNTTVAVATEKTDAVSREVFSGQNTGECDFTADNGTTLAMGRVTVEIDIDINITIENSGNGSGNINSSGNGNGTDNLNFDSGNYTAIA